MKTAIGVFLFICLSLSSCKSSKQTAADKDDRRDESALQEYVNEPKRQANTVKDNLEAAQKKAEDQASAIEDDE